MGLLMFVGSLDVFLSPGNIGFVFSHWIPLLAASTLDPKVASQGPNRAPNSLEAANDFLAPFTYSSCTPNLRGLDLQVRAQSMQNLAHLSWRSPRILTQSEEFRDHQRGQCGGTEALRSSIAAGRVVWGAWG